MDILVIFLLRTKVNAWGGTRIEEWTPSAAYLNSAVFKDSIKEKKNFQIDGIVPGQKFESMLKPIIPFAIKGMLWYQGESNCIIEDQQTYPEKVKLMVETYRSLFKNAAMPFYYVQIAPYLYSHRKKDKKKHIPEQLAVFREAQAQCLSIPYSGMVVTTDLVDNASNIHPPYKWDVAHRLALLALNNTYGRNVVCSGPTYKSYIIKRNKVIISFNNIAGGLVSHAESGLTLASFKGQHRLEKILSIIKPGDYLFIEFGHNDQKMKGKNDGAWKSYTENLKYFIHGFKLCQSIKKPLFL